MYVFVGSLLRLTYSRAALFAMMYKWGQTKLVLVIVASSSHQFGAPHSWFKDLKLSYVLLRQHPSIRCVLTVVCDPDQRQECTLARFMTKDTTSRDTLALMVLRNNCSDVCMMHICLKWISMLQWTICVAAVIVHFRFIVRVQSRGHFQPNTDASAMSYSPLHNLLIKLGNICLISAWCTIISNNSVLRLMFFILYEVTSWSPPTQSTRLVSSRWADAKWELVVGDATSGSRDHAGLDIFVAGMYFGIAELSLSSSSPLPISFLLNCLTQQPFLSTDKYCKVILAVEMVSVPLKRAQYKYRLCMLARCLWSGSWWLSPLLPSQVWSYVHCL